jgi:nucleoid-associated protein EbfC
MHPDESNAGSGVEGGLGSLGGMPDLQSLLQQASAMQERLMAAQQDLEDARVDGTSAGGAVQATVSGAGELLALTIDRSVCDPDDTETLADLVVAAVRNAVENAQRRAAETMGGVTGGLEGMLGADLGTTLGLGSGAGSAGGAASPPSAGFTMPSSEDDRPDRQE